MIKQRSFWTYLLLSFVTCGIYDLIFMYTYTEELNRMCQGDGEESPNYIVVILLSFITCGIYGFYWIYKQGNRMAKVGFTRYHLQILENGTTILLWRIIGSFFFGIGFWISQYILIKNFNTLADNYNVGGSNFRGNHCSHCGSPLNANDKFCPSCGKPVHSTDSFEEVRSQVTSQFVNAKGEVEWSKVLLFASVFAGVFQILYTLLFAGGIFYPVPFLANTLPGLLLVIFGLMVYGTIKVPKKFMVLPLIGVCFLEILAKLNIVERLVYGYSFNGSLEGLSIGSKLFLLLYVVALVTTLAALILSLIEPKIIAIKDKKMVIISGSCVALAVLLHISFYLSYVFRGYGLLPFRSLLDLIKNILLLAPIPLYAFFEFREAGGNL